MTHATRLAAVALASVSLLPAALGAQVVAGQVDTFEDGTTQSWRVNLIPSMPLHPAPPANVATGGPAGTGDNFLQLTAVGGPGGSAPAPGSRLAVINFGGQWAGNYTAAGITHIRLDANNLGTSQLFLRLVFENPALDGSGPPCDFGISATPIALAPGSGWTSLLFPIHGPGGLVGLPGGPCGRPTDLNALLANTTALRIIHNPAVSPDGSPVVAVLGVDNIAAVVVPEPSTLLLVGGGLLLLPLVARRRGRR